MDMVYCDFAKAFNKVPKMRLVKKLKTQDVVGKVLMWIENWLIGRRQRVVLNGVSSCWEDEIWHYARKCIVAYIVPNFH